MNSTETVVVSSPEEMLPHLGAMLARNDHRAVRWSFTPARDGGSLDLNVDGVIKRFTVVAKLNPARRDLGALHEIENPLLLTVKLPDSLIRHCAEFGASAIGLDGRVWIRSKGLLLDTRLKNLPAKFTRPSPEIDPFSPRSARLARTLLSTDEPQWRIADLAKKAGLSLGRVSEILGVFVGEEWVQGARGDWRLTNPDALLDSWAASDNWGKRGTLRQYACLESDLDAIARKMIGIDHSDLAFTQWFAANHRYPYTTPPVCSAYRSHHLTDSEQQALGFREVTSGGKLWVIVPRDEGVFQFKRIVDGFPLACDVQIYLDLLQTGLRGPDQARALRTWEGFRR